MIKRPSKKLERCPRNFPKLQFIADQTKKHIVNYGHSSYFFQYCQYYTLPFRLSILSIVQNNKVSKENGKKPNYCCFVRHFSSTY